MVKLLQCLLLAAFFSQPCQAQEQLWTNSDSNNDQNALLVTSQPIQSWSPVVAKVAPSVVNISGKIPRKGSRATSLGSGIIINKSGYIVTADHIINNATEIKVTLLDNQQFDAKVIGKDRNSAVALLKIETNEKLPSVSLGNSEKLSVGDFVICIGNPFGTWPTASAGIVGALGGPGVVGALDAGFIQTDASINPGNAGGPMCNMAGAVVGINTAVVKSNRNVGFAIPIDFVKKIIRNLLGDL